MAQHWCSYCGSKQHGIEFCPKTWGGQRNRNALRCGYCGARNHNTDACPKKWPGAAPKSIDDAEALP